MPSDPTAQRQLDRLAVAASVVALLGAAAAGLLRPAQDRAAWTELRQARDLHGYVEPAPAPAPGHMRRRRGLDPGDGAPP